MGSYVAGFKRLHVGLFDEDAKKVLKNLFGKMKTVVLST